MAAGVDPSALQALADSRLVLDALPWAVVVVDTSGAVIAWNRRAHHLYGWEPDEVRGRPGAEVLRPTLPEDDRVRIIATVHEGEVWRGEVSPTCKNGEILRVFATVAPLRDGEGRVVGRLSINEDITDLHVARQQAADLTERLQLALAAGELGTWQWDLASGAVSWDRAMERLYGLEPGTFGGTFDAWMNMRGDDEARQAARDRLAKALADREPFAIETEVVWPDGSVRWLHGWGRVTVGPDGEVTGAIGCTADITARKTAEIDIERRATEMAETARRERLQHERLAFLARITDSALAARDHRDLMDRVTRLAVPHLGDWCAVHFVPEPGARPAVALAHVDPERVAWLERVRDEVPANPDARQGVAAVIRTGVSEFVPVVDEIYLAAALSESPIAPEQGRAIVEALSLTSLITVPLRTKRGVLGAMQFVSAESGRVYHDDDVALAEAAAGRIAESLDNLWLMQQQRSIADTLQSALLPPALPDVPGIDVAVRYWVAGAANEVGGDFYDLFAAGPDKWAVVIGDVCGTGADGAAVTVIARHTIRAAATHGVDHRGVVEWLNDAVLAGRRDRFCTAIYATLEPAGEGAHDLTMVAGGHPLPVLVREDGSAVTVGRAGTLVGVYPRIRTTPETVRLHPGDTLVLYTDGVTDLPPPDGLTADDAARLIRRSVSGAATADDVAEAIGKAIETIRPIPDRADDIALVVLRVLPPN
jgi:PAS domain S-box-containing protein